MEPHIERWTAAASPQQPYISPQTGGVLLSLRWIEGRVGTARVDLEPIWDRDDPSQVHQLIADIADAAGMPEATRTLRRAIGWGAWGEPGVAPGPFIGVGGSAGAISLRAWAPLVWPQRGESPWNDVLATPAPALPEDLERPVMAGVQVGANGVEKVSTYSRVVMRGDPRIVARHAVNEILSEALRADATAYRGWAMRLADGDLQWQPVAEIEVARVEPDAVARMLGGAAGGRVATQTVRLIDAGLYPSVVAFGMATTQPSFSAVYFSPTPPLPPTPYPRLPEVAATDLATAVRHAADEPLQSVVAGDGTLRTGFIDLRPVAGTSSN